MPYKITITRIDERKTTKRGQWTVVDKRPWKEAELDKDGVFSENREHFLQKEPLKEVFGYTPDVEAAEVVTTTLLEQTVENLDLVDVIKAVNGIQP